MKLQSLLFLFAVCTSAEAADEISLMKLKATNSCEGCDLSNDNFKGPIFQMPALEVPTLNMPTLQMPVLQT